MDANALSVQGSLKFWPGTVAVEVFVLANAAKNGSELFFDDLLFEEITPASENKP